jgi:hypothetical protein
MNILRCVLIITPIVLSGLQVKSVHAQSTFILTGDQITSVNFPRQSVRLGERLPVIDLKKRFARYRVQSTVGEDCIFCAYVTQGKFGFSIDYDETGTVVSGITCSTAGCADALGNTIGASLRRAVGSQASCDPGYVTTCQSKISELSYIVDESKNCQLNIVEKKETPIPSCARIGGFQIWKR